MDFLWMVSMIRGVLFIDLDSTLVLNPLSFIVMPTVYKKISERLGIGIEHVRDLFRAKHIEKLRSGSILAYDWDHILGEVLSEIGFRGDADDLGIGFVDMLRGVCNKVEVLDNAPEILGILASNGYYLVLSTNGLWKYQECVLRESGLYRYFREILTPDRRGFLKSSREFYRASVAADLMISIGDNIVFDVYYPKLYGLKALHVKRHHHVDELYARALGIDLSAVRPDATIYSLQEIPDVLSKLLGVYL